MIETEHKSLIIKVTIVLKNHPERFQKRSGWFFKTFLMLFQNVRDNFIQLIINKIQLLEVAFSFVLFISMCL